MRTLVVLPSYNERLNVVELAEATQVVEELLGEPLAEVWSSFYGIVSIAVDYRFGDR